MNRNTIFKYIKILSLVLFVTLLVLSCNKQDSKKMAGKESEDELLLPVDKWGYLGGSKIQINADIFDIDIKNEGNEEIQLENSFKNNDKIYIYIPYGVVFHWVCEDLPDGLELESKESTLANPELYEKAKQEGNLPDGGSPNVIKYTFLVRDETKLKDLPFKMFNINEIARGSESFETIQTLLAETKYSDVQGLYKLTISFK